MRTRFSRWNLCVVGIALLSSSLNMSALRAQQNSDLPANWRELPVADFVAALQERYDEFTHEYAGITQEDAVRERAASLFRQINVQEAATSEFPVITGLYRAAWKKLDENEQAAIRNALVARQDDWAGKPYIEMREKVGLMGWVDVPFELRAKEAMRWVDAGNDVSQVFDKDLPLYIQHVIRQPQVIENSFSVRWEGRINAPQTGQYTFSISPINVSAVYGEYNLRQTMTVSIDGQPVLSATPEQWTTQSSPVQLTAGEPVAIVVETSIESPKLPVGEAHALLFWEGPGVAKSIVPQDRLTLPTTNDVGLRATYTWKAGDEQKTIVQVDPNVEFAWTSGRLTLSNEATYQRLGSGFFWSKMIDPQYLADLENNTQTKIHPLLADPASAAESLPVARRQAFLDELLARPRLLEGLNATQAVALYKAFRIGTPDAALAVFGRWARQNANIECGMPYEPLIPGVDNDNREAYRILSVAVTQQLPAHAARLQNEFLELEDGTCCLPVAYTLAYSYLSQDRLNDWIEILNAKLQDQATAGDRRVNWLLARAHADEIRQGPAMPYVRVQHRVFDGRVWID